MAYSLKFNNDVTKLIYSFRDFTLENVIKEGGTPSAIAMKAFKIVNYGYGYIDIERGPQYQRYQDKWKCWVETYLIETYPVFWPVDKTLRPIWMPSRTVLALSGLRRGGFIEKITFSNV